MSNEDKILQMFEDYFASASQEELEADRQYIDALSSSGITLEGYLATLNDATSYTLIGTGLCDDIAYSDLFNSSIIDVEMGGMQGLEVLSYDTLQFIAFKDSLETAQVSNYALAA